MRPALALTSRTIARPGSASRSEMVGAELNHVCIQFNDRSPDPMLPFPQFSSRKATLFCGKASIGHFLR